jgi:hypothetical protein
MPEEPKVRIRDLVLAGIIYVAACSLVCGLVAIVAWLIAGMPS